ncbi:MAG: hypothetical protein PHD92_10065 [Eubacteriales bacterium]|jgi:hypothetical protein|nr:hypothetical protein [Eubacteriales bacterium]
MKTRFCIFILTCLLAVGVIGCSTPEEAVTTNAPSSADAAQVTKTETKKEVQPPGQKALTPVVPVRDPFVPLVMAAAPAQAQTNGGTGGTSGTKVTTTQNTGGTTASPSNNSQDVTFELAGIYQQNDSIYASLRDGKQVADVTVGDDFGGYQVAKIDLQNDQVTLSKGGQIIILKNSSSTK